MFGMLMDDDADSPVNFGLQARIVTPVGCPPPPSCPPGTNLIQLGGQQVGIRRCPNWYCAPQQNQNPAVLYGGYRVAGRSGRTFRGYGDDPNSDLPAWLQGDQQVLPDGSTDTVPYQPDTSGGTPAASGNTGTSATPWWQSILGQGVTDTGAIAGGIIKAVTGANTPCGQCPAAAPYCSPVTRQCYPTAAAAQAASGGSGMLLVGAIGVGLLVWLASGKGGPAV